MITALNGDRQQIAALATSTSDLAARIVPKVTAATYDQGRALRMMKAVVNDADYITRQGERPAEQATMALQSLYTAYSSKAKPANDAAILDAIKQLFTQVDNPSSYNAFKFADQMKVLSKLLP